MRRKLFNLVATLSLLLFMAVVVLWVRSYWVTEAYLWRRAGLPLPYHSSAVLSGQGVVQYAREDNGYPIYLPPRPAGYQRSWTRPFDSSWIASGGGSGFAGLSINWLGRYVLLVTVPDWMLLVSAGVWPAAWVTARFRRRNRRVLSSGRLCAECGYDLRATPDRCPECGAVARLAPSSAA